MQTSTYKDQVLAPYEWYRTMRATQPVFHDEEQKVWHLFRYSDVQRAMSEYATFSSDPRSTMEWQPEETDPILASILRLDPPRHRQLRNLASMAFTPRVVTQLAPRITEITNELLDKVSNSAHELDVVRDLAYPLPVTVIAELLGIPTEMRADFKRWSDALVSDEGEEDREVLFAEIKSMYGYFAQVLEERRQHPQDDLVSALLAAEIEGQRLSDIELLGFCALLLVAGNETTTNLIANSVLCFDQNPGVVERLRRDPNLLPGAIEEALRYLSPIKAMARFTRTETVIGDQQIGAREVVITWLASANRDESQFPQAERFDIERTPNRHIAFGHGIHFCLGAPLARLEAKIMLGAMLERFPGQWHVPDDAPLQPIKSDIVFGVKNLPLNWG
ncbi:cytochrome P450 [Ktedonosporobacter rubrisoli]|uniref:Cytochrome P450 n=1 Tax=Ktedonosporobacter rubrisoli TaxID=2509675 RepID=A0A4P6JXP1_KTERU|nr:cytochrome P450 [Ktedonosporobacter rubrisoli]QBD80529.1 cytochrome P450 [Ktedonosporobacter rubrisoli]